MRFSNMHTHSTFSDGKNTPEEIVKTAIEKSFTAIGLSDHSDTAPYDPSYCMMRDAYPAYLATLAELEKKYEGQIEVLSGIELDYYSEPVGEEFDYRIASVHYLCRGFECFPIDHSLPQQLDCIERLCGGSKLDMAKRYYDLVVEHVARTRPEIVGHFDVITKFGLFDDGDPVYEKVALEALDEVLKHCRVIEVNTGAISRGVRTVAYPNDFLLRRVLEKGGAVTLSADSHAAPTIDCHFAESVEDLRKIGFDHILSLGKKGFSRIDI